MNAPQRKGIILFSIATITVLATSQLGSYLVEQHLALHRSIELTSFFHLTHVRNLGGVFGMFQGKGWVFAIVSLAFLAGLVCYIFKEKNLARYEYLCYGLIVGGGGSNILDRLIYGSVIDFIDIKGIPYWNYIFNTADTMIHLGIWPLLLMGLTRMGKPNPSDQSASVEENLA